MGSGIYALGTRAMFASQAMLDTTAHNISNANTQGYSRQQVELATEGGLYTGAGFFGRGVRVATVTRSTNEFLIKEANINTASASADRTRLDKLEQLEKVLPTGQAGLGYAATQFLNAFVDVANQPQDMSARQVVLARAQEFVSRANTAGRQLDQLQAGVVSDVDSTVKQINTLTSQIAQVNQNIAKYKGIGHEPNDLLDERDRLLSDLNKLVQVNTIEADDGSLNVFMGGGQLLVLSNTAQELSMVRDPDNSALARVALRSNGSDRILDSSQITGGALKGLIQFQDGDLAATRRDLAVFVGDFTNAVNAQQALGIDADRIPGADIFGNTGSPVSLTVELTLPKGVAASSPLVAMRAAQNAGTADIASLAMLAVDPALPAPPSPPRTITFAETADPLVPSGLVYQITDGAGTVVRSDVPWVPGSPLQDSDTNPSFNLMLSGVPKGGDELGVASTQYPANNNGNALAMLTLRDRTMVSLDGGSTRATVTDAYSQMIGNLGVTVQGGKTAASISATLEANSARTLSNTTGVNLDEEAAHLIQYQQSYQAAAKILQIAQTVFDTLLDVTR